MQQIFGQQKIHFHILPQEYEIEKKNIEGNVLTNIYSKFNFNYLNFSSSKISDESNKQSIKTHLLSYLKEHKLITIEITSNSKCNNHEKTNFSPQKVNSIICFEGNCLIVEEIELDVILMILKETNSSIFNVSENSEYKSEKTTKDEEINNFCHQFISTNQIKNNTFVKSTIKPMITYLMQRYYFPSNYFKDPSFL